MFPSLVWAVFFHSKLLLFFLTADIDDLRICYVLRNEENDTSDLFHFSIEDSGKTFVTYIAILEFTPHERKGPAHDAKWHFNKMSKDTNWLSWISKLPLYLYWMFYATFRLIFSGEAVSHLISEFLKVDVKFHSLERISHTVVLNCAMGSWAVKHHIAAHSHFNFAHYSWQKGSLAFYTSFKRWGEIETHRSVTFRWVIFALTLFTVCHFFKWSSNRSSSAVMSDNHG